MKRVYDAINDGLFYKHEIIEETKLREGQVRSAIYNLTFISCIVKCKDKEGRTIYRIPGFVEVTAECWAMASSVFGRFTPEDDWK
jgi:transcription initiation factor IIE alpha subunit